MKIKKWESISATDMINRFNILNMIPESYQSKKNHNKDSMKFGMGHKQHTHKRTQNSNKKILVSLVM